ncbi:MAG: GTPase Era [Burkholderiales bacterium]
MSGSRSTPRRAPEPASIGAADAAGPPRCGHVAVVGRPSVGKSTLVNALVGERVSITSKKPQTTRHRIVGIANAPRAQTIYVDTPGFQTRHASPLNSRLNRAVKEALADVDVVVWVVDAARLTDADRRVLSLLPDDRPVVVALNKVDLLPDKSLLLPRLAELAALREFAALVPVSAERGMQLDRLAQEVAARLPEGPPLYGPDELTDRDERFLAAEYLREQIFRRLGDEVPYATTVGIESFEHRGAERRIGAVVWVDKPGQRAILLGQGGETMKAIASEARRSMLRLFGGRVHLEVWVRVKKGWADDDASLARLGY